MADNLTDVQRKKVVRDNREVIRSLYRVQVALGVLGFLLPAVLIAHGVLANGGLQSSISHTYHTAMGDVLVGTLCAIGVFLFAYKDFNPEEYVGGQSSDILTKYWDRWWARLAGLGAIGVALFPVDPISITECAQMVISSTRTTCSTGGMIWHGNVAIQYAADGAFHNLLHFIPAFVFFLSICVLCFRFFPEQPIRAQYLGRSTEGAYRFRFTYHNRRTLVYYAMGLVIALSISGLLAMTVFEGSNVWLIRVLEENKGFFWLEVIAVVAFAVAWLTKSRDYVDP